MWMNSSVGCPQFLGHASVGYDPLVSITFPVGSSLIASLIAHMSCSEGYFLIAVFRASQSTLG